MRLEELAPLFAVPNVTFYSLQVVVPERDEVFFQSQMAQQKLVDLRGRLSDFLATSTVVAQLDLVITVDTAVAHLAGALGKPVWMLVPFVSDWRWLRDRTESPWYPTMRLFRQERRNEWGAVVERVAGDLNRKRIVTMARMA
jgi:ADP-heptose:LPS heptosyltransferase